jgi:hypothetical protein
MLAGWLPDTTHHTNDVDRLKMTWVDILTMAAMGAIGLGVYEAHPAPSRSFPVTFVDGEIGKHYPAPSRRPEMERAGNIKSTDGLLSILLK